MEKHQQTYFMASFISRGSFSEPYNPNSSLSVPKSSTILVPIDFSSEETPLTIPIHLPISLQSKAAIKIQSCYRGHLVRTLIHTIFAVNSDADRFERIIQQQETVDAILRDEREKIRLNEGLMSILFKLDSVPGFYTSIREIRRNVSRRIVGLQEILDSICNAHVPFDDGYVLPMNWSEITEKIAEIGKMTDGNVKKTDPITPWGWIVCRDFWGDSD